MTVLETARRVIAAGPVCDACLGRPFAARSHGLTNAERGRALRVALALADDEPFEAVDPTECWVCEGLSGTYDDWADAAVAALGDLDVDTYQVGSRVPPLLEENDRLLREDAGVDPDAGEGIGREVNREVGRRVGEHTSTEVDFERPDVLFVLNLERAMAGGKDGGPTPEAVDVQVNPAFVYGRYRKLERDLPQTEWPCRECGGRGEVPGPDAAPVECEHCGGSGYLYEESVEELTVPPVVEAFDADEGVFHGAGREDVDALMVGTGRPFVIEVKHPRERSPDPVAIQAAIAEFAGGAVEVEGLRLATHEMVERVKELDADKTYRATVAFDRPVEEAAFEAALEELAGATVHQDTPERVRHRRAEKTRTRRVHTAEGTLEEPTRATVEVSGEGGLYVKELVSGDGGRTEPSLAGLLGVEAEVTALDVVAVEAVDGAFDDEAFLREDPA